jgi:hypothetical protein
MKSRDKSSVIDREAKLATALQGCLGDFVVKHKNEDEAALSVISGLASTFGWFLSLTLPREKWATAVNMFSELTIVAAAAHAQFQGQGETRQ